MTDTPADDGTAHQGQAITVVAVILITHGDS
jgi:hypothetical protein